MTQPLAVLGLDIGDMVGDALKALVDLVVPDFGADWVSRLVTWLVALPPVNGGAFPTLTKFANDLTAVGFGILGATFLAGLLMTWAGGLQGATGSAALTRTAVAAGALATYPIVLQSLTTGTNILTAEMIRHPAVRDGLDKAFGEALTVAAVTGGLSIGLAIGATVVVLYFVAALFVLKIGLTAAFAVAMLSGGLVWGLYPVQQTAWLARAWVASLTAALVIPIAWACVFAAAALLARDTLVFDGGSNFNNPLGDTLAYLVKPFAAVACFWLAYRAPHFLLGLARTSGLGAAVGRGPAALAGGAARGGGAFARHAPGRVARAAVRTNADRFRALAATGPRPAAATPAPATPAPPSSSTKPATGAKARLASAATAPKRLNDWWRALPDQGRRARQDGAAAREEKMPVQPKPSTKPARPKPTQARPGTAPPKPRATTKAPPAAKPPTKRPTSPRAKPPAPQSSTRAPAKPPTAKPPARPPQERATAKPPPKPPARRPPSKP